LGETETYSQGAVAQQVFEGPRTELISNYVPDGVDEAIHIKFNTKKAVLFLFERMDRAWVVKGPLF
jgi:hypothetical protein